MCCWMLCCIVVVAFVIVIASKLVVFNIRELILVFLRYIDEQLYFYIRSMAKQSKDLFSMDLILFDIVLLRMC